jgi:hypothetical protein
MHGLKEANERLSELREILWADVRFWKRVAAGYSAEQLSRYIRDHYRLGFPAWPAVVWQQMVHQPQKREKLLSLHRYEIDFDEQRDEDALRDMRSKLEALNAIRNDIDARYGFRNGAPRINLGPCGRFARDFRETWNKRFRNPVCSLDLAFKGEL